MGRRCCLILPAIACAVAVSPLGCSRQQPALTGLGAPTWSHDGLHLAAGARAADGSLAVVAADIAAGGPPRVIGRSGDVWDIECHPYWSPTEAVLAYASTPWPKTMQPRGFQATLRVRDTAGAETAAYEQPWPEPAPDAIAWSPDGSRLASARVADVNGDTGSALTVLAPPSAQPLAPGFSLPLLVYALRWNPDGSDLLAICGGQQGIRGDMVSISPANGAWTPLTSSARIRPETWLPLPDGNAVAFAAPEDAGAGLHEFSVKSGEREQILSEDDLSTGSRPTITSLCWSADGRLAAWATEGGIWTFDRNTGDISGLTASASDAWPAWSPDGSRIACVRDKHAFVVIEVATGDESTVAEIP